MMHIEERLSVSLASIYKFDSVVGASTEREIAARQPPTSHSLHRIARGQHSPRRTKAPYPYPYTLTPLHNFFIVAYPSSLSPLHGVPRVDRPHGIRPWLDEQKRSQHQWGGPTLCLQLLSVNGSINTPTRPRQGRDIRLGLDSISRRLAPFGQRFFFPFSLHSLRMWSPWPRVLRSFSFFWGCMWGNAPLGEGDRGRITVSASLLAVIQPRST